MQKIALWKLNWLPQTETFIRAQQDSYSRYKSVALGLNKIDSPLSRESDILINEPEVMRGFAKFIFRNFGISKPVKKHLAEADYKLIHAHFANQGFSIAKIAKKLKIPLVVSLHGHDINEAPFYKGLRGAKYRLQLRYLFGQADHFIAISEAIRDRAIELGCQPSKITVRYTGIEITPRNQCQEYVWDLVFVGRLIAIKGPDHLLQAASILNERYGRNTRIAIVGSGPMEGELRKFAQENQLNVDFFGHQNKEKIKEILDNSLIFIGPSHRQKPNQQEGFGMVYLEAALSGLPVVSYRYGGIPEAVVHGETGYLADEGKVSELAEYIKKLLDSPTLTKEFGEKAYRRVTENFDIKKCTAEIEDLYDTLIMNKKLDQ